MRRQGCAPAHIYDPYFLPIYRTQLPAGLHVSAGLFYEDDECNQDFVSFNVNNGKEKKGLVVVDKLLSFLPHHRPFRIIASHNGLILCMDDYLNRLCPCRFQYYICNPVTKQYVTLPEAKPTYLNCFAGFYVYYKYGHYHIIKVPEMSFKTKYSPVESFSSRTGRWKQLEPGLTPDYYVQDAAVPLSGALHWEDGRGCILVFYVTSENFTQSFDVPLLYHSPCTHGFLGVSAGSLSYAFSLPSCPRVWVRASNQWLLVSKVNHLNRPKIVSFDEFNPRVVFLSLRRGMVSYNIENKETETHVQLDDHRERKQRIVSYSLPPFPLDVEFQFVL